MVIINNRESTECFRRLKAFCNLKKKCNAQAPIYKSMLLKQANETQNLINIFHRTHGRIHAHA